MDKTYRFVIMIAVRTLIVPILLTYGTASVAQVRGLQFDCIAGAKTPNASIHQGEDVTYGRCSWNTKKRQQIQKCTSKIVKDIETKTAISLRNPSTNAVEKDLFQVFLKLKLKNCDIDSQSNFDTPVDAKLQKLICLPLGSPVCKNVLVIFQPPLAESKHCHTATWRQIAATENFVGKQCLPITGLVNQCPPTGCTGTPPQPPETNSSSVVRDISFAGLGAILLAIGRWLTTTLRRNSIGSGAKSGNATEQAHQGVRVTARFTGAPVIEKL
jgi:hypothetical protein